MTPPYVGDSVTGPLGGVRVVENSAYVAVPLTGLVLRRMGADVIRVEPIGPTIDRGRWPLGRDGQSLFWAGLNAGKRSIAVDLRKPAGRELVASIATAPASSGRALISSFPLIGPLSPERLTARCADFITLRVQGDFDGRSAVDYTVAASTGVPLFTGGESLDPDEPVASPVPTWDISTGLLAANAILGAEMTRRTTGKGAQLSLALSDVAIHILSTLGWLTEAQESAAARPRTGNGVYGAFGGDFLTRDGKRLMVVAVSSKQWQNLASVLACPTELSAIGIAYGGDLSQESVRYRARYQISDVVRRWLGKRTMNEAVELFDNAGVCWSEFRSIEDFAANDPRTSLANPLMQIARQGVAAGMRVAPEPLMTIGQSTPQMSTAPDHGADTVEILQECLLLTDAEIGRLQADGVISAG